MLVNEISMRIFTVAISIFLARHLGVEGFGLFSLSTAIGVYLATFVDLGVASGYGAREVAQRSERATEIVHALGSLRIVLALVLAVGLVIGALLLVSDYGKRWAMLGAAVIIVSQIMSPEWIFRGLQKMELILMMTSISTITFFAIILLTVRSAADTQLAILARAITFGAGSMAGVVYLSKRLHVETSWKLNMQASCIHLRQSVYFAINTLLATISVYMPLIALSWLNSSKEAGLFSAAQKVVLVLHAAVVILSGASYPTMAQLFVKDRKAFQTMHDEIARYSLLFGIPVTLVALAMSSVAMMTFVFGDEFAKSGSLLKLLIWQPLLVMIRMNYGRSLICSGEQRFNVIANGIGSISFVLFTLAAVPVWGGMGAVMAIIIGESISLICMRYYYRKIIYGVKS